MSDNLEHLAEQIIANAPQEWQKALRDIYEQSKLGGLGVAQVLAQAAEAEEGTPEETAEDI